MRRIIVLAAVASLLALIPPAAHAGPCDFPIQHRRPAHIPRGTIPPLAIGDSTMVWAVPMLAKSGFEANARLCRPFREGVAMIDQRRREHRLPQFVVLALGASSPVSDADVDRALKALGPHRVLGLATHRFFLGHDGPDTETIRRAARRHPNRIKLIDWVRVAKGHPGWFSFDGLHPNLVGAHEFAKLIAQSWREARRTLQSNSSKSRLRAPHTGQNQSSGMSANSVPGGTPPSGSPSAGS